MTIRSVAIGPQPRRGAPEDELDAERDRLLVRPCGQLPARHPGREAQVVAHHRAGAGLAPDGGRLDDDDAQPFGRRVHGRGESRGAGADHGDVDTRITDRALHAERDRHVGLGRLHDGASIGQDDDRQGTLDAGLVEQRTSLRRRGVAKPEWEQEPSERVAEGAGGRVPWLTDDGQSDAGSVGLVGPPRQRRRQDRVELLVRRAERPRDPGVDLADREGLDRLVDGAEIGPVRQEQPLRRRVESPRRGEELRAGLTGHVVIGDDHRDRPTFAVQVFESVLRLGGRALGRDVVVVPVAAIDRVEERRASRGIVIDDEDDGQRTVGSSHGASPGAGRTWATGGVGPAPRMVIRG